MNLTPWNPGRSWSASRRRSSPSSRPRFRSSGTWSRAGRSRSSRVTDIVETGDEYRLYLSLPGMLEEDIDIALQETILIIRGEREPPFDPKLVVLHQRQWRYGYFERRVQLPRAFDAEAIQASYDAGVLTIRIRKGGEITAEGPDAGTAAGSQSGHVPPQTHGEEKGRVPREPEDRQGLLRDPRSPERRDGR